MIGIVSVTVGFFSVRISGDTCQLDLLASAIIWKYVRNTLSSSTPNAVPSSENSEVPIPRNNMPRTIESI